MVARLKPAFNRFLTARVSFLKQGQVMIAFMNINPIPMLTVLMSVYNAERTLSAALQSILAQEGIAFEFLVIDDGSSDNTPHILQEAAAQDSRLRILRNPKNIGLTRSLQHGLTAAQGQLIARQDADDISLPGRLADGVAYLQAHPNAVLVTSEIETIDEDGNLNGHIRRAAMPHVTQWRLLFYNEIGAHGAVIFRRDAALGVGGYDESRRYSQDYHLWLRLATHGDLIILPHTRYHLRRHADSISSQHATEQEHLSLLDSQAALRTLTGCDYPLDIIAKVRAFWLEPFPSPNDAPDIAGVLSEAYGAFAPKLNPCQAVDIRRVIAEQWGRWANSVSGRANPITKARLMWAGKGWY